MSVVSQDVVFTYPESSVPAVKGATVECSLRRDLESVDLSEVPTELQLRM